MYIHVYSYIARDKNAILFLESKNRRHDTVSDMCV